MIILIVIILISTILILLNIAFYTLLERRLMAAIQRRRGPNIVGFYGLFQPFADGLKLLLKEISLPYKGNLIFLYFAPIFMLTLVLVNWLLIGFSINDYLVDSKLSLLLLFTLSSFSVYSIILAGWASNSRYPFIGAIRAVAQMISYELVITIVFFVIAIFTETFSLNEIYFLQKNIYFVLPLLPLFVIFLIAALVETNRAPFDLPEAEAELVAGYNIEYSSMIFAFFFLGEYASMILISAVGVIIFFGGETTVFSLVFGFSFKLICIAIFFIVVRAAFPRIRYDQILSLGWVILIPAVLTILFVALALKLVFSGFIVSCLIII